MSWLSSFFGGRALYRHAVFRPCLTFHVALAPIVPTSLHSTPNARRRSKLIYGDYAADVHARN